MDGNREALGTRWGCFGRVRQNGETFDTFREEKNGRTFALKDSNNDMNIT